MSETVCSIDSGSRVSFSTQIQFGTPAMDFLVGLRRPGVLSALGAALLFGAGTPLAKLLLNEVSPWMLAGLLYLGSGIGLTRYRRILHAPRVRLPRREALWLSGAVVAGGIVGPVLLMIGLSGMPASSPLESTKIVGCPNIRGQISV